MLKIVALVALVMFVSGGAGILVNRLFHFKANRFSLVYGFAAYLFGLQLFYYPGQLFHLNSLYIMGVSLIWSGGLLVYAFMHIQEIIREYQCIDTIWILISAGCFFCIFYLLSVSIEISDSQVYINYICQNIQTDHLNYFDFWTGKIGEPTEPLYLFQGFYHFGSFLCWFINIPYYIFQANGYVENIAIITWGLGLIYNIISVSFMLDVVAYFELKNKWIKNSILLFMIFFYNFYYWRVGFAFYGNTFRTLFIGVLLFMLVKKYQDNDDFSILALTLPLGAGLASSSSYLFISFDILYVLMVYLFLYKKGNPFKDMAIIVFPIVFFTTALIFSRSSTLGLIVIAVVTAYYILAYKKLLDRWIDRINSFFGRYGKIIFLIIIPVLLVIYAYYLSLDEWYLSKYSHYFNNHAEYDMVIDPFGRYSNGVEKILVAIRWSALGVMVCNRKKENHFLVFMLTVCFLLFLTPLTTPAIAKLYTDFVYYRAFDILINPFTEILYLVILFKVAGDNKILKITFIGFLGFSCVYMHSNLVIDEGYYSSYNNLLEEGQEVNSLFKITYNEYELFVQMRENELLSSLDEEQITLISHAEGVKSFFPQVYQIFSRRQFFDESARVNEEFYQIAKRKYGWLEPVEVNYGMACEYMYEYEVDLAIINFYENGEFDQATDGCMNTVMENGLYKVKMLNTYD